MRYENPLYMAEEAAAADLHQRRPAAARHQPRIAGARAARAGRSGTCPRDGETDADMARAHTDPVPRRDRRRRRGARRPADDGSTALLRDPAAVARASRADLVGRRHARDRGVGGGAGHEPDELDAAHRGHGRAFRRAAGRADRAVPRALGSRPAGARAARLGQPQRHPDGRRPRPAVLRRRCGGERDQVGVLDGAIVALRQELHRRARRDRGGVARRTRPCRRRTRCC